jgi:hypothetical protein
MEDPITTFCFLVVEEFLSKQSMHQTLSTFREEWETRPDEVILFHLYHDFSLMVSLQSVTNLNWMNLILKLHLADMISASPGKAVLEIMSDALLRETSVRMRQKTNVLLSGIAERPKSAKVALPSLNKLSNIEDDGAEILLLNEEKDLGLSRRLQVKSAAIMNKYCLPTHRPESTESRKYRLSATITTKGKPSNENWLPEQFRFRSIRRELSTIKDNMSATRTREIEHAREMKHLQQTDLQRAHAEESLRTKKKARCACCLQPYSYVNLTMKLPVKAIIDIRKKWTGGKGGWWDREDERLGAVPRCYEGVDVCRFCSQFFHNQEEYRPSFDTVAREERRAQALETKLLEKAYWDPLLMVEKDREAASAVSAGGSAHNISSFDGDVIVTVEYE